MTKESRGIDNVSLKCFIVGRCRSGRSSNRFPFFSSSPLLPFLKATLRRGKLSTFISANDKSMRRLRRQNGSIYFEYIRGQIFDSTFPLEIYGSFRKKKKNELIKIAQREINNERRISYPGKIRRLSFVKNRVHRPLPKNKGRWPKVPRGVFRRIHGSRPFSN